MENFELLTDQAVYDRRARLGWMLNEMRDTARAWRDDMATRPNGLALERRADQLEARLLAVTRPR
jgi:hypothetical protein